MIGVDSYREGIDDCLWQVFYTSIHIGCVHDYSSEQLQAWCPDDFDRQVFSRKMRELNPYIASIDGHIVGYADLQSGGYIDHFYVHGEYQKRGVGAALMTCILVEGKTLARLYSDVSNTAKPFFEKYGFRVIKEQIVAVRGQHLQNNLMEFIN